MIDTIYAYFLSVNPVLPYLEPYKKKSLYYLPVFQLIDYKGLIGFTILCKCLYMYL